MRNNKKYIQALINLYCKTKIKLILEFNRKTYRNTLNYYSLYYKNQ